MSLLRDVRIGEQRPTIQHLPPDVHSLDAATEAIELADSYGVCDGNPLSESQRVTLEGALGERANGSWAASTVADFGPRQGTGKNDKIAARELAGLILFGEKLQIHTAHQFDTANESFMRMVQVFDNHPDLMKKVIRIRYANGEQGIELKTGQRLKYKARTGAGGRGFAKADLIVYDEAQHLQAEMLAASGPAKMANPNSQTWYAGSGGLSMSRQAWALRRKALSGEGGRLAYTEMTAEVVTRDDDGRLRFNAPVDLLDRDVWYRTIPGLGIWVTEESVMSQYEELGPELFAREILCVWDPLPDEQGDPKLPRDEWTASKTLSKAKVRELAPVVLAFDVDLDGTSASVGYAAGVVSAPYVEVLDHEKEVGWLARRVVDRFLELSEKRSRPIAIAYNNAGPAEAAVGAVTVALRDAGISLDLLSPVTAGGYRAACGELLAAVTERRLLRCHEVRQGPLDLAASDATERPLAEGWVWHRRQATVPISPLVAVTVAAHLLPVEANVPVAPVIF